MKPAIFWDNWLWGVGWLIVAFGWLIAFANQTGFFEIVFGQRVNAAFGLEVSPAANVQNLLAWMYAVLGATVAGWGIFIAMLARHAFRRRERWVWQCMFWGLTLWFVPDTAFSAYYGVWVNVAVNVSVLAFIYLPLFATRREFFG